MSNILFAVFLIWVFSVVYSVVIADSTNSTIVIGTHNGTNSTKNIDSTNGTTSINGTVSTNGTVTANGTVSTNGTVSINGTDRIESIDFYNDTDSDEFINNATIYNITNNETIYNITNMSNSTDTQKLKLTFYITKMSRETRNFLTTQFRPTFFKLKNFLDVEFIPWDKSESTKNETAIHHHGSKGCFGSRLYSCALAKTKNDQIKQVEYINCVMNQRFTDNFGCIHSLGINETAVIDCCTSGEGHKLLKDAERRTKKFGGIHELTIVVDDTYDERAQAYAMRNFKKFTCHLLENYNPIACTEFLVY